MRSPIKKSTYYYLAISLFSGLIFLFLHSFEIPFVEQVDLKLKDLRLLLSSPPKPDRRVAIVAIDSKSVKTVGRWPWSREKTAELIRKTAENGAAVIALDMVFSEPQGDIEDKTLADTVASCGNVILGYFFRHDRMTHSETSLQLIRSSSIKNAKIAEGVTSVPLREFKHFDTNIDIIAASGIDAGFFNQLPEIDGLYRKTPLFTLHDGDIYPSLALKGVAYLSAKEIELEINKKGISSLIAADSSIPCQPDGTLPLAWYGSEGALTTISAADIISGITPAGALNGKLVFIGFTEKGIFDLRATPLDPAFPGVEIHATAASNILQKRFVINNSLTRQVEKIATIILPLAFATLLSFFSGGWRSLFLSVSLLTAYTLGNFRLFDLLLWDISPLFPALSTVSAYIGCEGYRTLIAEREGKYLQKAFSSYVSPDLVSELVKNPDKLKLGGEKREITLLFSDIRGFTTLSEGLSPELLVALLNRYLTPMTRIVLEEKGTLDKYIGDAVMAIFNAPLDIAEHPAHACRTAIKMIDALKALNIEFEKDGLPSLAIGVGIHTGEAVVGNMGAENRFDYTAIGDSVNLASRLEGMTKQYGVKIIISEFTAGFIGDEFHLRELDLVRVKGKHLPVRIYELRNEKHESAADYMSAINLYRERQFHEAFKLFNSLSDDNVAQMYKNRCVEFLATPPPEDWDGVYIATSK